MRERRIGAEGGGEGPKEKANPRCKVSADRIIYFLFLLTFQIIYVQLSMVKLHLVCTT